MGLKKYTVLCAGAFVSLMLSVQIAKASPWAAVGDMQLRNDVEILARHGVISGPVNTWPISWKQITRNLSRSSEMDLPAYVRLAAMRVKAKIPGELRTSVRVQATNNPAIVRGFAATARNDLDADAIAEYNSDSGTTVHIQGGYRKGNGEDYTHLDGSYLSQDMGNWSAYFGAFDRWWGPGRESTLILSNNARPMPSVGLRRIEPKAFETKWLSWMGPWQWDMFVAKMEKDRQIPNALVVGMRLSFEPVKNFEVGLSRTMQLCGDGRPCSFEIWARSLIGGGNLENGSGGRAKEPGNQLASIDLSYTMSVGKQTYIRLYGEGTGDDETAFLPYKYAGLIGASLYGSYGANGSNWRFTSEYSSTISHEVWFFGKKQLNILYEHGTYSSGYRFKNRSLGHSLDSDSELFSVIAQYQNFDGFEYSVKYHIATINSDSDIFPKYSVSSVKEKINLLEANVKVPMKVGNLGVLIRLYDDSPNTPDDKKPGIDINLSWIHYF